MATHRRASGNHWRLRRRFAPAPSFAADVAHRLHHQRRSVDRSILFIAEIGMIADGKETFISLGMWEDDGFPFEGDNIRYLYCKSEYPARYDDLADFPERCDRYFGYSDHLMGIEGCLPAIARGARLVEKHFTLNRTSLVFRDHGLSATPDEFPVLIRLGRELASLRDAIGSGAG